MDRVECVVLVRVAPTTRTRASTSHHLQLAAAVPGNPGLGRAARLIVGPVTSGFGFVLCPAGCTSLTSGFCPPRPSSTSNGRWHAGQMLGTAPLLVRLRATSAAVLSAACRPAFPIRWQ